MWLFMSIMTINMAILSLSSCKEKIDDSDLYTFTGEMMIDHFEADTTTYGHFIKLLKIVTPSKNESASTMYNLLRARGHYTCFAPTNEAIEMHLDSLLTIGEIDNNTYNRTKQGDFSTIPDSVSEAIVYNCIIENGDNEAFSTIDFEEGALSTTNMNDRYISISYGNKVANVSASGDTALATVIYVNTNSIITEADIEVENGYIHKIDRVLSPSNSSVSDLIINTPNTKFFGELLTLTGWDKKMTEYKDTEWEEKWEEIRGTTYKGLNGNWEGVYPEHRYVGFTAFVETDSVFAANGINDLSSLKSYVQKNAYYEDDSSLGNSTSWGDDYEDDYNWLNQFVAYHLLPERLTYNHLVMFANEYGCPSGNLKTRETTKFYVNVWEYWETLGIQRRPMKITGIRTGKMINRKSKYANSRNVFRENISEMTEEDMGITISSTNGTYDNNALNGYYYPINKILIWNQNVPNNVLNERMRIDVTAMFPEMMTNNIRQYGHEDRTKSFYITTDYFDNMFYMADGTDFEYLPNTGYSGGIGSWMNYQIDEFNIRGNFDFTMKLPAVPYTGTYEIRYGINANNNRGMAQVYIGKNPNNLPAIGIPLDLRSASGTLPAATGWVEDIANDDEANAEIDKSMRNLGFMKGPKYIQLTTDKTCRDGQNALRKIIYTGQLEAGQTYYIRFKSVLSGTSYEFFYDYLEIVPKSVYAGDESEDIW